MCETSKAHLNFGLMTSTRLKFHLVIEYGWIETQGVVQSIYSVQSCSKPKKFSARVLWLSARLFMLVK